MNTVQTVQFMRNKSQRRSSIDPPEKNTTGISKVTAHRYHDFSAGIRLYNFKGKSSRLHGHNYRIHFYCNAPSNCSENLVDFSDIKKYLCNWLEENWDHRFLVWDKDPWASKLKAIDSEGTVIIQFNPTSENIAQYLLDIIGPQQLITSPLKLYKVVVQETVKCSAIAELRA